MLAPRARFSSRRCRSILIGLTAAIPLVGPALASACSQDNATFFEGFLDTSCLQVPLTNVSVDALGGLRLDTTGASSSASWDTDDQFANGITHDATLFGRVGTSTLALSGAGSAASLGLPTSALPLNLDVAGTVLAPTPSSALDNDHVDGPSVLKVAGVYVMYYAGLAEDGSGPRIFRATSADGKSWTRASTPNTPVLTGTPGAFDEKGVFGPHVIYDPADLVAPYRMYYSGRGAVFGAIGYATSLDGVTWVKHTGTPNPSDPPVPVLDHGEGGSADSFRAADPWVIKDGAVWKMWYTGDDSNLKRIAYATSVNGVTWQKGGSVLSPDGAGGNFGSGIYAPTVWKNGSTFEMLFVGLNTATKLISATSPDGITWTTGNVALNTQNGSFHASNFDSPAVFDEGVAGAERFKLYYSGSSLDASGNFHVRIGLSITASGSGWQGGKFGGSQTGGSVLDIGALGAVFDARGASGLAVIATGGIDAARLVGFYSATRGSDFTPRLGQATSPDGTSWSKVVGGATGGALFATGNAAAPDNTGQTDPSVLLESGTFTLYYTGRNSSRVASIVRTTSPQDGGTQLPTNAWTARAQVLAGDGSGFDADEVAHPSVLADGPGNYLMFYTGIATGGAPGIGRAQSTSDTFTAPVRTQVLAAGAAGSVDAAGVKDPVVVKIGPGDYRMIYTAVDVDGIERLGVANSTDGATWTKQGIVLNPSQAGFAHDERGVRASGMFLDGSTLQVYYGQRDRTGRERSGHAAHTIGMPSATVPSGWATYQLGDTTTSARDWRTISRTSTGDGVGLWLSFLQPYSGTGSFGDLWSDYFPVTSDSGVPQELNLLLTVRGVRWQARLTRAVASPTVDAVTIDHAPVQFATAGSALTTNVEPPSGLALTGWGNLTVRTETFAPIAGGVVGATVSVRDAGTGAELIPPVALNTSGETTHSLAAIDAVAHRRLRLALSLTSDGVATPKVRSAAVSYAAVTVTDPIAFLTATPTTGSAPLLVTLDGSASLAPAGRTISAYNWDLDGNGTVDQITTTPATTSTYLGGSWAPRLTITDSSGAISAPATRTITATDLTPPLSAALIGPASLSKPFQVLKTMQLKWTASDPESTIGTYALIVRSAPLGGAFGAPTTVLTTVATGTKFTPVAGATYCFRVRATNNVGLATDSKQRCTAQPLSSYSLAATGAWSKRTRVGHYLNRYRVSTRLGSALSRSGVTVKRLSLIATRGKGMGSVAVYLGTVRLKTVNLAASTTRKRQVIAIANFTKIRKGTVRIRVVSSGKPVLIEGIGISKV